MELLPSQTILRVRSSDILVETLQLWNIPKTRENLQDLAIYMDRGFGKGTFSGTVKHRIEQMEVDIIIFDGVRWLTDVDLIKSFKRNLISPDASKQRVRKFFRIAEGQEFRRSQ